MYEGIPSHVHTEVWTVFWKQVVFWHLIYLLLNFLENIKLLWKECLISNGHQFTKVNNNLSSSLNTKKTTTSNVGNPGPDLEQAQKCDGVELVNGIPNPTFDNWISNVNTYTCIHKRYKKKLHRFAFTQKDHIPSQNGWQQKHGEYNSRFNELLWKYFAN